MWKLAFLMGADDAAAADRSDVRRDALRVEGDGYVIHVLGRGVPLFEKVFSAGVCRITFTADGAEVTSRVRECPDALRDEIVPASKYWMFEVEGDATGATFDAFYIVDGRGILTYLGPSRSRVQGDELLQWELVPEAVEPPAWPVGQSLAAWCQVTVTLDPASGHVAEATVSDDGCPSGYVPSVLSAARMWDFEPVSANQIPIALTFDTTVRFSPPSDGADATIEVDLPVSPEAQLPPVAALQRAKLVSTPPLFKMRHKNYADVLVHGVGEFANPPVSVARRCSFIAQVNSSGNTWMWPEECPSDLLAALEASRQTWTLVAGKPDPGEMFARFRGFWELPPDGGTPVLRLPEVDLVARTELPTNVRSYAVAEVAYRVPPKLPKGFVLADPQVCSLDVTVGTRGRVSAVVPATVDGSEEPGGCDPALLVPAQRSVTKWKWKPAASDGEPFESHASVKVRFGGGA